jgi:hypothetical protein
MTNFEINHLHLRAATVEIQYCWLVGVRTGQFIGVILLVSVVLIQLIPITFYVGQVRTTDTKEVILYSAECRMSKP